MRLRGRLASHDGGRSRALGGPGGRGRHLLGQVGDLLGTSRGSFGTFRGLRGNLREPFS